MTSILRAELEGLEPIITKLIASITQELRENAITTEEAFCYLEKLKRYRRNFNDTKSQMYSMASKNKEEKSKAEDDAAGYVALNISIDDTIVSLERIINEDENNQELQRLREEVKNVTLNQSIRPVSSAPAARLPKLTLPLFHGDKLEFPGFWEMFEAVVHRNDDLPAVTKFQYLKSYLRDKANACIAGLEVTGSNYLIAIDLLKSRFLDNRGMISKLYQELQEMPQSSKQASSLRSTYDDIRRILRCLQNYGEQTKQGIFVNILLDKFPNFVRLKVEELNYDNPTIEVDELMGTLDRVITTQERCFGNICTNNRMTDVPVLRAKKIAPTIQFTTSSSPRCIFCSNQHWSDECTTYKSVRERKQRLKGRCFRCLRTDHTQKNCRSDKVCVYCKKKFHHRSLCIDKFEAGTANESITSEVIADQSMNEVTRSDLQLMSMSNTIRMQIIPVSIKGLCEYKTRVFLDSGSQRSYINANIARQLNLKVTDRQCLTVYTFAATTPKKIKTNLVEVPLITENGFCLVITANTVPQVIPNGFSIVDHIDPEVRSKINKFNIDLSTGPIDILIGNDFYGDVVRGGINKISPGMYIINTVFGWMLSGRQSMPSKDIPSVCMLSYSVDLPFQNETLVDIKNFWDLEVIGITDDPIVHEDDYAVAKFNASIVFEDGRYVVSWPWKCYPPNLPTNLVLAQGRLRSLIKRLTNNCDLLTEYNNVIADQLRLEMIEEIDWNPLRCRESAVIPSVEHYLPHHPVIRGQKMRIVFDASARTNKGSNSLNDCLYKGRPLTQDLVGILLRFRNGKFAMVADIEKAFLQIGLHPEDRDATRFLWLRDPEKGYSLSNMQVFRFTRIPFGVISSPFLLNAVLQYHLKHKNTKFSDKISHGMYVDNLVVTSISSTELRQLKCVCIDIFREAGMNLRDWQGNLHVNPTCKTVGVLGISWNLPSDTIQLRKNGVITHDSSKIITKRLILRYLNGIFDPLGLFCPLVLRGKLLLRTIWEQGFEWDDELPIDIREEWNRISIDLSDIFDITISRCADEGILSEDDCYELHCFADASKYAYASAIYLKNLSTNHVSLIFGKSRVSPLKTITIPRMELIAVNYAVKLAKFVESVIHLNVKRRIIWTDSQCVLCWITTTKPLPVFVENRIKTIKSLAFCFKFVPTKQNPADLATRPLKYLPEIWWRGPNFLMQEEEHWPDGKSVVAPSFNPDTDQELALVSSAKGATDYEPLFPIDKYSSLNKLLRVTAYCFRFIKRPKRAGPLNLIELEVARSYWIKLEQERIFCIGSTRIDKNPVFRNLTRQLSIYKDNEGILRCRGRLRHSGAEDATQNPILLPRESKFTELVINYFHVRMYHSGTSATLAEIRLLYWIPKGRTSVRKVLRRGMICRKYSGNSYTMPALPDLPAARVNRNIAFTYCGVDYLGPLYITEQNTSSKVWVCLFTCLTVRAIHLELVHNLTAVEFLMALRRFIARRGRPHQIISDNATQFKLTSAIMNSDIIHETINWKTIPALSPWAGGFYERLVALVKSAMKKSIGRTKLSSRQLTTILTEIEATLNSRPLTYVSEEPNLILTPSQFLCMRSNTILTGPLVDDTGQRDPDYSPSHNTKTYLIDTWKKGCNLMDIFWKIWFKEYVLALRERGTKSIKQNRDTVPTVPAKGDVVLVADPGTPRNIWKIAKIAECNVGCDGHIRSAKIIFSNGKTVTRPLTLLHPLELPPECRKDEIKGQ